MSHANLLDQLQSLARLDALDPASYAAELAAGLGEAATVAELDARDEVLRRALVEIDAATERAMRLRLDDADLLPLPTRKVFATTIAGYAGRLELLVERVRRVAGSEAITAAIVAAARASLDLRDALRAGVLALIAERYAAAAAVADRHARDRTLDDGPRKGWSAARRDLEQIAAQPAAIAVAPAPARRAAWPEQLDEPDPASEPTFADMIELD